VSYERKHNEDNGEGNRDGADNNLSWNCGEEGPTENPQVRILRARQKRNLLSTLLLSQGVPMLLAGDEFGRTQRGNNNAYCHDNATSWLNWDLSQEDRALFEFVARVIRLRRAHPIFRRRSFFTEDRSHEGVRNVRWFGPDGLEMSDDEWNLGFARCLGMYLAGDAIGEIDRRGAAVTDDNFMLLINAHHEEIPFVLPGFRNSVRWRVTIDTSRTGADPDGRRYARGEVFRLQGRSLVLLQQRSDTHAGEPAGEPAEQEDSGPRRASAPPDPGPARPQEAAPAGNPPTRFLATPADSLE
jgi:glycogen operon protein